VAFDVLPLVLITIRVIRWVAKRMSNRIAETDDRDAVARSESVKHRVLVVSALRREGIATKDGKAPAATGLASDGGPTEG
jgi:hypothetical protein